MRIHWLVLTLVLAALVPSAVIAHGGPAVGVQGDVRAGGGITVTGEDFPPGEAVDIALEKAGIEPLVLGAVTVEEGDAFEVVFHVPENLRPGLYQLVAVSGDESASAQVTVLAAAEGGVPSGPPPALVVSNDRSGSETALIALLTAAIAAMGALLLWLGRTRPRHAHV
jgi:hypothetical protein